MSLFVRRAVAYYFYTAMHIGNLMAGYFCMYKKPIRGNRSYNKTERKSEFIRSQ